MSARSAMSHAPSDTLRPARSLPIDRTGVLFAVLGAAGLAFPFIQFKANRLVGGDGLRLPEVLAAPGGWLVAVALGLILVAGIIRLPQGLRLILALGSVAAVVLTLGLGAGRLTPEGNTLARVSPGAGFWLLLTTFALMGADAMGKLRPPLWVRALVLAGVCAAVIGVLASGLLDPVSVMREYHARQDLFWREARMHVFLAFGSLGLALVVGLPLGVLLYQVPRLKVPVLSTLNMLQTIPSLALFGIMIPILGWVAANVPGAAAMGIAGIGFAPALIALFLYSLLPVVSNTVVGLEGVSADARDAARGLGMTDRQVMFQILLPLALPVILAAVRIVLVQNIGLAVIAGLIGGGGFGSFVFQGLNQTAMDLVLVGALPTVFMAIVAGIALDLAVEALSRKGATR
ncbi:ABC transporter permease [Paracoccus pacificus]|uniref:ABC transporter permease n=1 Tax=Paracoccus pacificus TaxID=1463598 RepID=A0ABW4R705_9RHOB